MKVNKNNWLLNVSDWITIHFGKNPKNGGRPPNDNKLKTRKNFIVFEWKNTENSWLIWEILNILNINTIVNDRNE